MKSSRFGRIRLIVSLLPAVLLARVLSASLGPVCPSFVQLSGSPVAVGFHPYAVALGDFNRDGHLDFAVANADDDSVSILLGDGTGGFSEPSGSPVGAGSRPVFVTAGDFDGDGKVDLAVANSNSSNVTILLGNGTGGFSAATGSPVTVGATPQSIAVGDFNRDGKLDLAVAIDYKVAILLGDGAGGFTAAAPVSWAVLASPESLVAGDFNRDGKLDLAVADYDSGVRILLGDGTGGFSEASGSPVSLGREPYFITTADLNGDGKLDLAVANYWDNSLSILLGDGAGGFSLTSASPIDVGHGPNWISAGDLDGDGKLDLAVVNFDGESVSILLGDGAGGFSSASISPVYLATYLSSAAIGDFDEDGKADLVVTKWAADDVSILLNTCDTITCTNVDFDEAAGSPIGVGVNPSSVALEDFNRDGKLDFAVANASDGNVSIRLGDGTGGFAAASGSPVTAGSWPMFLAAADFNHDGKLDLAVVNENSDNVSILLGDGTGGFSGASGSPVAVGNTPSSAAVGDFNGDGNLDLAVSNITSEFVTILLGDGAGGFTAGSLPLPESHTSNFVVAGDFNRDGRLDLALTDFQSGVRIFLGDGTGGFSEASGSPVGLGLDINPYSLTAADLNGDGKLDLAVAEYWNNSMAILLGDGAGGFTQAPGSPLSTGDWPSSIGVADLNRDGKLDLAVADWSGQDVRILLGDGAGGFTAAGSEYLGNLVSSVAFGDFDGNGKPDLAVSVWGSNDVRIFLNACGVCVSTTTAVTNVSTHPGEAFNLTATVTSSSTVTSGSVTFKVDGEVVGTASVVNGTATLLVSGIYYSPSNYPIEADYSGTDFCGSSNTGTLTVSEEGEWTEPRALKEEVLSDLEGIRATVTDRDDRGKLDDAIKHLTKSLNPLSWIDDYHVKKGGAGESVFNEEKPAVDRLKELIRRNRSGLTSGQLQPLIDSLFAADRGLAGTAIDDAIAASGKPADILHAQVELARGDASASAGRTDAIDHYKKAWKAVTH